MRLALLSSAVLSVAVLPVRGASSLTMVETPLPVGAAASPHTNADRDTAGIVLHVRRADSVAVVARGGRRFDIATEVAHDVDVENRSGQSETVTLWLLRGTQATRAWSGRVTAGARSKLLTIQPGAATDVVLLQWGTGSRRDDDEAAMEGERSRLYYFVTDKAAAFAGGSAPVRAPPPPAPALEQDFDRAAAARKESFESLLQSRGVERILVGTPNYQALRVALASAYAPGTAMLMYAPSGDTLTTWLIAPDGSLHRHVAAGFTARRAALNRLRGALRVEQLQAARSPVQRGVAPANPAAPAASPARTLSEVADLLYPRALHRAMRAATQLVIVPALDLGTVPFAALPHPAGGMTVDHAAIVMAPSICDVVQLGHRVEVGELARAPLIVGDPTFPEAGTWAFPPLPGARREAAAVAAAFGAVPIGGDSATSVRVAAALPSASLIYLATHGIASERDPLDGSFLQFAAGGGASRDGRLTARTIQTSRLRARLAVLSACQTGLGQAHDGGIIGVARSFINAGASQVVMSLWSVDDDATTQLMTAFVAELRAAPPPEALRRAMRQVRDASRRTRDPVYWASFAVIGATW